MSIGDGEFIVISTCNRAPYQQDRFRQTLTELTSLGVIFREGALLDISPKAVSFSAVWEGVEEIPFKTLDLSQIDSHCLAHVEFIWMDVPFRLNMQFLDEESYEVSVVCSYETISAQSIDNGFKRVEQLALKIFENLRPVFGCIGVERSVDGLDCVRQGDCFLPVDKSFYNAALLQFAPDVRTALREHASFQSNIDDVGCYFRLTDLADYKLIEPEMLQEKVERLKAFV